MDLKQYLKEANNKELDKIVGDKVLKALDKSIQDVWNKLADKHDDDVIDTYIKSKLK